MMEGVLINDRRVDEGRVEAEHGRLEYKDSSDAEEIKLLPHKKGADEPDPPGAGIRDVPETSDTLRDEWLLKTEPLHGVRPRWHKGGGATSSQIKSNQIPSSGTQTDGGFGQISHWGCSRPEHGTSRRSDSSVATGSADHAGGGSGNATEEGS